MKVCGVQTKILYFSPIDAASYRKDFMRSTVLIIVVINVSSMRDVAGTIAMRMW